MAKEKHGFATWPKQKLRVLARKARKAAADKGTVHKFTQEESARNNLAAQIPERRRALGAMGGRKSQRTGKVRLWATSDEARRAALQKGKFFGRLFVPTRIPTKRLLTVREAIAFSGLSTRTVNNCLKDGRLNSRKSGRRRLVITTSVVALMLEYRKLY